MENTRDSKWWHSRSKELIEEMRLNTIWVREQERKLYRMEPKRVNAWSENLWQEDWSCEPGGDRYPDGKVPKDVDNWQNVRKKKEDEGKKKEFGESKNGGQIELGLW